MWWKVQTEKSLEKNQEKYLKMCLLKKNTINLFQRVIGRDNAALNYIHTQKTS